jgi:predicted TIM-barrel fold metal-dependent hydrolase
LQAFAPRFDTHNGVRRYLLDGLPPYQSLPNSLDGVWDDPNITEMMLQREYRLTWETDGEESSRSQSRRILDQRKDGVEAEIIYMGGGTGLCASPNEQYQVEASRLHNEWIANWIKGYEYRMVPSAVVPLFQDHVDVTINELTRARKLGFQTANLPVAVPWLPYYSKVYEPLWSALEDLDMTIAFHVFSGSVFAGADFSDALNTPQVLLDEGRRLMARETFSEQLATTVMGMAAGMSPVVHLIGSGILERHPKLRFVIVEAEMGWLGWTLQSMDAMAHKRKAHFRDSRLRFLPSEYFKMQGWITFTDDAIGMAQLDLIGPDRVMWSNDYCHDEGIFLESQSTIGRLFAGTSEATQRKLLWENAAQLYGLDSDRILKDRAHVSAG